MSEAEAIPSPPNGPPNGAASVIAPDISSWLEITHQAATLIDPKVGNVLLRGTVQLRRRTTLFALHIEHPSPL
jgi:hypothetical protein